MSVLLSLRLSVRKSFTVYWAKFQPIGRKGELGQTLHTSYSLSATSSACSWGEFSNILPNIQLSPLLSWSAEYSQCIKPHMITTDSLAPIHHSALQSVVTPEFPLCWLLRAAPLRCFCSNPSIHNKDQ